MSCGQRKVFDILSSVSAAVAVGLAWMPVVPCGCERPAGRETPAATRDPAVKLPGEVGETEGVSDTATTDSRAKEPGEKTAVEWSNSLEMLFRVVEPGEFLLTVPQKKAIVSAREQFRRRQRGLPPRDPATKKPVRITRPFAIGLCEVTQSDYVKVMGREPAHNTEDSRISGAEGKPAVSVTWDEADEFCRKLSELPEERKAGRRYRLPTEAEWEWTRQSWGRKLPCFQWSSRTLHWTVWEYCSNWFDSGYYENMPRDDPVGPPSGNGHVVRLAWTHPDPWIQVYTFRVVAEEIPPAD